MHISTTGLAATLICQHRMVAWALALGIPVRNGADHASMQFNSSPFAMSSGQRRKVG